MGLSLLSLQAQRFEGGFVAGINASQLDGDNLSGYNKIGGLGGFWVKFPFNKKWLAGLEFLFTQKGAIRKIDSATLVSNFQFDKFRLNYLELPLFAEYTYKKFGFQAGITTAYLLSATVYDFTGKQNYKSKLKPFETGLLLGAAYQINPLLQLQIRFQYSINSIAAGDNHHIFNNGQNNKLILGLYNNLLNLSVKYRFGG